MARPSKRDEILKVAGDLFLAHGYRRVSIDQIVETVPISKPTLYAHFKDKSELFLATMQRRCQRLMAHMQSTIEAGRTVEETLYGIGYEFLEMVMSTPSIQLSRVLMAEIEDFPAAAKLYFNSGPQQMHLLLANYLSEQHRNKQLQVKDAELSADMFLSMIKGYAHLKRMLGVMAPLGKKEMQRRVRYAVDLFLTAHAV